MPVGTSKSFDYGIRKVEAGWVTPFFSLQNPTRAFIQALQETVGAVATGTWDEATHNLTAAWVISIGIKDARWAPDLPAWGVAPDRTAVAVSSIPFLLPEVFAYVNSQTGLVSHLNMPLTEPEYRALVTRNLDQMQLVMAGVREHIAAVEWDVPASRIAGRTPPPETGLDVFGYGPEDVEPLPPGTIPPVEPYRTKSTFGGWVTIALLTTAVVGAIVLTRGGKAKYVS